MPPASPIPVISFHLKTFSNLSEIARSVLVLEVGSLSHCELAEFKAVGQSFNLSDMKVCSPIPNDIATFLDKLLCRMVPFSAESSWKLNHNSEYSTAKSCQAT